MLVSSGNSVMGVKKKMPMGNDEKLTPTTEPFVDSVCKAANPSNTRFLPYLVPQIEPLEPTERLKTSVRPSLPPFFRPSIVDPFHSFTDME